MAFWVILACAWVLGRMALSRVPAGDIDIIETVVYRLCVGLCLCALFILAVGSLSLDLVRIGLYAIAIIGLGTELFASTRSTISVAEYAPWKRTRLDRFCIYALAAILVLSLIATLAPVTAWDAVEGHLALAQAYMHAGRIGLVEGIDYSGYPHLMHALFTYAFYESGEVAATMVNWTFALLACAALFILARRVESARCGLVAAALLATAPIFMDQAVGASLDLAFLALTLTAFAALMLWYEFEAPAWLILGAFLAGSACGVRHTGYLVCALFMLGVFLAPSPSRKNALVLFSAAAIIAATPWLLRSAILTGNPVYPFYSSVLSSNSVPAEEVATLGVHPSLHNQGWIGYLRFPWDIIMSPEDFDGWSKSPGGFVLFLGLPGLLVARRRARWLAAYALLGISAFFMFRQNARYMLPFFAPLMVLAAAAFCRLAAYPQELASPSAQNYGRFAFSLLPLLLCIYLAYGVMLAAGAMFYKVPVVVGLEKREDYLAKRVEHYDAMRWVNENLTTHDRVLTFDPRSYFLKTATYQNREAIKLLYDKPFDAQLAWLKARGITHVLYPRTYVEGSKALRVLHFPEIVDGWVDNPSHFVLIRSFERVSPRSEQMERVEIYEIH